MKLYRTRLGRSSWYRHASPFLVLAQLLLQRTEEVEPKLNVQNAGRSLCAKLRLAVPRCLWKSHFPLGCNSLHSSANSYIIV